MPKGIRKSKSGNYEVTVHMDGFPVHVGTYRSEHIANLVRNEVIRDKLTEAQLRSVQNE